MYLMIEDNPNCTGGERVFSTSGPVREVKCVYLDRPGTEAAWCDVAGVNEDRAFSPAQAVQVEDSGAGTAWLVFGGAWGLRCRSSNETWSLENKSQWGVPFLVLDISGQAVQFAD